MSEHTDRWTDTYTNRRIGGYTNRQFDRRTYIQTGGHTHRRMNLHIDRCTDTYWWTDGHTDRSKYPQISTHKTGGQTLVQVDRRIGGYTYRQVDIQTD